MRENAELRVLAQAITNLEAIESHGGALYCPFCNLEYPDQDRLSQLEHREGCPVIIATGALIEEDPNAPWS